MRTCSACGTQRSLELFQRGPLAQQAGEPESTVCRPCWYAEQELQEAQEAHRRDLEILDTKVREDLAARGLSPRELKADMAKVKPAIRAAVPKKALEALLAGRRPEYGFGLGGNTGGGKTMALAAILKVSAAAQYKSFQPQARCRFGGACMGMVWTSWPDEVTWLRKNAIEDTAAARVDRLSTCSLLVLDDLGRERIKGSYAEDWAASQLDAVINHRYRHELPILWTTNVPEVDLAALYGGAMLSRLTGDNPLAWVHNLQDQRGER